MLDETYQGTSSAIDKVRFRIARCGSLAADSLSGAMGDVWSSRRAGKRDGHLRVECEAAASAFFVFERVVGGS